jgi:starvation-inducible outer membrane lipoprotein
VVNLGILCIQEEDMKKILLAVVFTALALSFSACASKAKAVEEPAPIEEQVDVEAEAVDAAE